jgi:hypothetical protein
MSTLCRLLAVLAFLLPLSAAERIGFHPARLDSQGHILPWYSANPGIAYDHDLNLLWFYWNHVPASWKPGKAASGDVNLPKYMVYRTLESQGIGGDQFAMMLSSWSPYYQYSGDPEVLENMIYQADAYLDHSMPPASAVWPNIPYPCNTEAKLLYDGDLMLGKSITQPDKAGSFGAELVTLYKITGNRKYLDAAVSIANTLASKTQAGDSDHSPLPFKVNALTGQVMSPYTTNWTGTLRLYQKLERLQQGNLAAYRRSFDQLLGWLKKYPLQTNKWGPFFEDIPGWSDTQINATTLAWYLMENKSWDSNWKQDVRGIQDWVISKLGNHSLEKKFGVLTINEQTVYAVPGQSHTSRHASVELRYAKETGDERNKAMAIRQLNWATYFVDDDGKNRYPDPHTYEIWWTDGYGDYVRHYLRAMAVDPELAPAGQNHILHSTSVVQKPDYQRERVEYTTFDKDSVELLRVAAKPLSVSFGGKTLNAPSSLSTDGWTWQPLESGGVLQIHHTASAHVSVRLPHEPK